MEILKGIGRVITTLALTTMVVVSSVSVSMVEESIVKNTIYSSVSSLPAAIDRVNTITAADNRDYILYVPDITVILPPPPPVVKHTAPSKPSDGSYWLNSYVKRNANGSYSVSVPLSGGQTEINRCGGPVRAAYASGVTVAEHNYCGGDWIFKLKQGDTVIFSGNVTGTYVVTGFKTVQKPASSSALDFAALYLQTCYFNPTDMLLVGLTQV